MPNAQTHLVAGTLSSLVLVFLLYKFLSFDLSFLFVGAVIGIIASEFPDIDHPNSLPRKILKGLMPALVIFVFGYLFLTWKMWAKEIWEILIFLAFPILIISYYEVFIPRHRGATHKWPGMAASVLIAIPFVLAFGMNYMRLMVLVSFAVIGFSTHVLLDNL